MNKIILIGNLTRDPELTTTNSGVALCRMGIAVNRPFANQNGEREVDYINIVAWRGLAENCNKFLRKGSKVGVCGRLEIRSYDDKEGNKRTAAEVIADDVEFLSTRQEGGESQSSAGATTKPSATKQKVSQLEPVDDDGDLPF